MSVQYEEIGYFRSPYSDVKGMPIQPVGGTDVEGRIELLPEYQQGLMDLEGFSHVIILSHLHKINGYDLVVKPFLDTKRHGIFATRSPKRPNPIGFSVMRLKYVTPTYIAVEGVDVLDGTPVLDIKPYVSDFDQCNADRFGWFEGKSQNATHHLSDARFA
ncbi:tRNA (N6-threonylcarbamoyladenosine(37)-N6)-methyltransferase TrmO [Desulforhopalus sp. IMCC35007]|uniref:tRNA (N6-threonylcarbamoyladenosine(37)-N6)-methyltransferase TrmO n=1 Tax=Desulforhopalus sp. IMCC35007 TaxID=2569543 RepID=UPI0010ADE4E7|nr:tRNA (N6-threonylcarbamoyladenosine(37)-N6)-methyltransferase TrmO [Desulforhopalus sp. IMCC35007]TKB07275.1 tRNA (N6-threonylcarbamoyladenosine(37)-N6)-methyltransferase TrmO [Desulforhopalus sp. IMCC35007]